jgi:hypothetical protein
MKQISNQEGYDLSSLHFNFSLTFVIRKLQEHEKGLEMNGLNQVFLGEQYK